MGSAMDSKPTVTILEDFLAAPSPGSETELSVPLSFYDMRWLRFPAMRSILFYEYRHPKTYFTETTIPHLKESFALALKHYLPLAGKLIWPLDSGKPKYSYAVGDSVPLIFAESSDDFKYLSANHAKDSDRFCPLLPPLPPATEEPSYKAFKLFSVQVTLFPNTGIAFGFTVPHVSADAATFIGFATTWAAINKHGGDNNLAAIGGSIPVFDRDVIKDPNGLDDKVWSNMKGNFQTMLDPILPPIKSSVRATFILSPTDIEKLKNLLLPKRASTYVVTSAYVWTCVLKSEVAIGEKMDEDEDHCFRNAIDCRPRFDPPIPATYFGNCIMEANATAKRSQLIREDGFLTAVSLVAEAIDKRVKNIDGILKGDFIQAYRDTMHMKTFAVAGSPKYDAYEADFGWGKPEKFECITLPGAMSLGKSRRFEGSLEVGLYLRKTQMDAFTTIFEEGLKSTN